MNYMMGATFSVGKPMSYLINYPALSGNPVGGILSF